MTTHVKRLLIRALEDDLTPSEQAAVAQHLPMCEACAAYERELQRNERLLREVGSGLVLPPLRFRERTIGVPAPARAGGILIVGTAALVVALLLATGLQWARERVAAPSDAEGVAVGGQALAFLNSATSELILVDDSGKELKRVPLGTGGYGSPAIHPQSGRLALWRFPERDAFVPAELVVWDGKAISVLARITDLPPWGGPVWSADGGTLYFSVASPPSEGGPNRPPRVGRLVAVDAANGTLRTLRTFENEWPIVPVVARADVVAGFEVPFDEGRGRYVAIDPRSGAQLSASPREHPYLGDSFSTDLSGTFVAGVSRRFESVDPTPLRFWPADDYSRRSVLLELRTMTAALFWPGRREILVTGARDTRAWELVAVSYDGTTRTLLTSALPSLQVVAIASDARSLVMDQGTSHELVVYPLTNTGSIGQGRAIERPSVHAQLLGWVAIEP